MTIYAVGSDDKSSADPMRSQYQRTRRTWVYVVEGCACRAKQKVTDATDRKIELLVGGLPRHESRASFSIKTNQPFRDEEPRNEKKESLPVLSRALPKMPSFVRSFVEFHLPSRGPFSFLRHEIIARERERSLSISIRIMNDE